MTNPGIPPERPKPPGIDRSITHRVAGWVAYEKPWTVVDLCEWTYKRGAEGDLTLFARNKEEALQTITAHGFRDINPDKLVQTGGKLADYLKKAGLVK